MNVRRVLAIATAYLGCILLDWHDRLSNPDKRPAASYLPGRKFHPVKSAEYSRRPGERWDRIRIHVAREVLVLRPGQVGYVTPGNGLYDLPEGSTQVLGGTMLRVVALRDPVRKAPRP